MSSRRNISSSAPWEASIGYSRAARIIEELEADGVVGPDMGGSRGREVMPGDGSPTTPGGQKESR